MSDPSRSVAAAALDLPADADAAAARACFLKKLPGENYLPPDEWLAALTALGVEVPLAAAPVAESESLPEKKAGEPEAIAVPRKRKPVQPLSEELPSSPEELPRFSLTEFKWLNYWWVGLFVVFALRIGIVILRYAMPRPSYNTPPAVLPATPPQSSYSQPQRPPNPLAGQPVDLTKMFTAEQLQAFEEFDPKAFKPEPRGYRTWLLLGGRKRIPEAENP